MNYSTSKDFKEYLIVNYIYEKGLEQVLNDIDSNSKAVIKRLASNEDYTEPNDLIAELDKKIIQAVKILQISKTN